MEAMVLRSGSVLATASSVGARAGSSPCASCGVRAGSSSRSISTDAASCCLLSGFHRANPSKLHRFLTTIAIQQLSTFFANCNSFKHNHRDLNPSHQLTRASLLSSLRKNQKQGVSVPINFLLMRAPYHYKSIASSICWKKQPNYE
jgi:hypothetical protein